MTMPAQHRGRSAQDFRTPADFIAAVLHMVHAKQFAFDLAASPANAQANRFFTEEQDALRQDWPGLWTAAEWGWLNPPFGDIRPWVAKCADLAANQPLALLVPASVGSEWWASYVHHRGYVLFLRPRLAFMPEKPDWLYPKDCALVVYGTRWRGYDLWKWK